ncbi:MAG: hypothetical protein KDC38_15750 [Planctomycetes bacterium]|nr:hypothetical protein [Planctomycetota bacterium]
MIELRLRVWRAESDAEQTTEARSLALALLERRAHERRRVYFLPQDAAHLPASLARTLEPAGPLSLRLELPGHRWAELDDATRSVAEHFPTEVFFQVHREARTSRDLRLLFPVDVPSEEVASFARLPHETIAEVTDWLATLGENELLFALSRDPAELLVIGHAGLASSTGSDDPPIHDVAALEREVRELHEFFEMWYRADLADTVAQFSRLETALAPDFVRITPSGHRKDRSAVLAGVRASHAQWIDAPDAGIRIEELSSRYLDPRIGIVGYDEVHLGPHGSSRRRSSAVLEWTADGRCEWRHLHETALDL